MKDFILALGSIKVYSIRLKHSNMEKMQISRFETDGSGTLNLKRAARLLSSSSNRFPSCALHLLPLLSHHKDFSPSLARPFASSPEFPSEAAQVRTIRAVVGAKSPPHAHV